MTNDLNFIIKKNIVINIFTSKKLNSYFNRNKHAKSTFIKIMDDDYKLLDPKLNFNYDRWLKNHKDATFIILFDKDNYVASFRMKLYKTDKLFGHTQEYFQVNKDNYMHISQVLVNPIYRGLNVCTKMLQKVINLNLSVKYVLRVANNNVAAKKCYKKAGFIKLGELNGSYYMLFDPAKNSR